MLAFVVAGVILGLLARLLRHGPEDPSVVLTVLVGVVGAAIGGSGMNAFLDDDLAELTSWSFTSACLVSFVVLGLLQGGVGRRR